MQTYIHTYIYIVCIVPYSPTAPSPKTREAGGRTALGQSVQNIREAASRHEDSVLVIGPLCIGLFLRCYYSCNYCYYYYYFYM